MMKQTDKKASIKTRILVSILSLIGVIFLCIAIAFNLLLDGYIENSSNEQLKIAEETVQTYYKKSDIIKPGHNEVMSNIFTNLMKEMQEKVKRVQTVSNAEAIVINKDYELIFPTRQEDYLKDIDKYESILSEIKENKVNLDSDEHRKVWTEDGTYYVSIVKLNTLDTEESNYVVLMIDITSTFTLEKDINVLLLIIMCIAGILSSIIVILLSKRIANPIEELSKFALSIGGGDFNKCQLNFSDRELDNLCQSLNKSVEQLDRYDKEQKIFFQNVSHELRTPLMSIKGYAEAIKYNVLDKDSASDIILEESNRLTDMVEELLYISKIDNITKDYTLLECDLREILSNCVVKQKFRGINKNIEFKYNFDDNEVLLYCDEKSIYRAFSNIIENGIRYAKSEMILSCYDKGDKLVINIENDGDKIKGEDLPYIFNRFYKGHKGKHGIGLSIVKTVVEKHNGKVYAENTHSRVRFVIEFPKIVVK